MAKLAVIALLGMIALAAALDAETMGKKTYKEEEEKEYKETGVTLWSSKANLKVEHKEWDLLEEVGKTHPCAEEYEIFGSTVAQNADLINGADIVGSVFWSGVVVKHDLCGDCKDYKAGAHHIVKVNYEVTFEFTAAHKGQLIAAVVGDSIFSEEKTVLAVVGGTGAFEGAYGTVTWTFGKPKSKYVFDVYMPKIVAPKEVKEVKLVKEVVKEHEEKEYYDKEHEYYNKHEHEYEPKYERRY